MSIELALLLAAASAAAPAPTLAQRAQAEPAPVSKGSWTRRSLEINDANASALQEIYCAVGTPTTIAFQIPLKDGGTLLADVGGVFYPPQLTEKSIILVPRKDPSRATTTLNVTLSDGTMIPFALVRATKAPDLQVDVVVRLEKQAAPDSAIALKATVAALRGQLDECQATAGEAGLSKVAALILAQDFGKADSFTVEHRKVHHLDKQHRLLVEVTELFRLFNTTYLVLTIQNRDGSKVWVLDRPELSAAGADIKVLATAGNLPAIPPDEIETIVVGFSTPPGAGPSAKATLKLFERNGARHVTLEGVDL